MCVSVCLCVCLCGVCVWHVGVCVGGVCACLLVGLLMSVVLFTIHAPESLYIKHW